MRCKVGDIAVVVGYPPSNGALVRIIKPGADMGWAVYEWECEALCGMDVDSPFGGLSRVVAGSVVECDDRELRPIRDPGEDAVDEILQLTRLKAPSPEFVGQTAFTDFGPPPGFVGV
jgi:hypothetical protein